MDLWNKLANNNNKMFFTTQPMLEISFEQKNDSSYQ